MTECPVPPPALPASLQTLEAISREEVGQRVGSRQGSKCSPALTECNLTGRPFDMSGLRLLICKMGIISCLLHMVVVRSLYAKT